MKTLLIATVAAAGVLTSACSGQGTPAPTDTVTVPATPAISQSTTPAPAAQGQAGQPPGTPSSAPGAAVIPAGCLSRYLYGKVGLTQGALGSTYLVIEFKNLDNVPCSLYGYPGVALDNGHPVSPVGRPAAENPATPRELVILQPHGRAHAQLRIVSAANYPPATCHPVSTQWIQVIPPNQTVPLYLPYTTQTCAKNIRTMTVDAVRPGPGGSV
jgi:hypothetical protein